MKLIIIRLLMMLGMVFGCNILYASELGCSDNSCVIVIDAGSTGSRLHLYQQRQDNISEIYSHKVKPGIASLAGDKAAICAYLTNLFSGLDSSAHLPVYFNATAGMRLLSSTQQQTIYAAVSQWMQSQPYQLVEAKTITGKQEGVNAWLAVNYFRQANEPVGVMDMGGASVQIVFPLNSINQVKAENIAQVNFNGKAVTLFSHSFLGMGQTEMTHQFLNNPECYSQGYQLPNGQSGLGDEPGCQKKLMPMITRVHRIPRQVKKTLAANMPTHWIALGGVTYLAHSPLLNLADDSFSVAELIQQGQSKLCSVNWQQLKQSQFYDDYLYADCFNSAYYSALINQGYGISAATRIETLPEDAISDWTLGVAIQYFDQSKSLG